MFASRYVSRMPCLRPRCCMASARDTAQAHSSRWHPAHKGALTPCWHVWRPRLPPPHHHQHHSHRSCAACCIAAGIISNYQSQLACTAAGLCQGVQEGSATFSVLLLGRVLPVVQLGPGRSRTWLCRVLHVLLSQTATECASIRVTCLLLSSPTTHIAAANLGPGMTITHKRHPAPENHREQTKTPYYKQQAVAIHSCPALPPTYIHSHSR